MFFEAVLAASLILIDQETDTYVSEVKRACSQEWGKDFRMVEYCQNQQYEAMSAVAKLLEETKDDTVRSEMLQTCLQEWPKGNGYDWRMAEYCYDQQNAAYKRLNP